MDSVRDGGLNPQLFNTTRPLGSEGGEKAGGAEHEFVSESAMNISVKEPSSPMD